MKSSKKRKNPPQREWTSRQEREKDNILRPELFSVPRHSHLLVTRERRKGEERSLVGKYLELADIALSNPVEHETPSQSSHAADKEHHNAA